MLLRWLPKKYNNNPFSHPPCRWTTRPSPGACCWAWRPPSPTTTAATSPPSTLPCTSTAAASSSRAFSRYFLICLNINLIGKSFWLKKECKKSNSECIFKKFELILYPLKIKVFNAFNLYKNGVKLKKLNPKPEKESLRYVDVSNLLFLRKTEQSRNDNLLLYSYSQVNLMLGCLLFK